MIYHFLYELSLGDLEIRLNECTKNGAWYRVGDIQYMNDEYVISIARPANEED